MRDDAEYATVKEELKKQGSWVPNRSLDALEKLGLDAFMGYLQRALSCSIPVLIPFRKLNEA